MIHKKLDIHNISEIVAHPEGGVSWKRIPGNVIDHLESELGKRLACNSVGVELRFVLKGESAKLIMSCENATAKFHVCRGGVQGNGPDCENNKIIFQEPGEFVIERLERMDYLNRAHEDLQLPWDPEVVRVVFDCGSIRIHDVIGDIEPPLKEQCPQKTLLCYGSSITHGSHSLDKAHSWVSVLAERLRMDYRNLGMAGSCKLEPEFAEYIASEGERGAWDVAVLELGINAVSWPDEMIYDRATNIIQQVAGRNPDKTVFVVSPFYYFGDEFENHGYADNWRMILKKITDTLAYPNVQYINGMDVLDNKCYMCADFIHPNIYGVQRIADRLTEIISARLNIPVLY